MTGKLTALAVAPALLLAASAWADPPQINGTGPFGVQRGVATEVTISGANLAGNPQLVAPPGVCTHTYGAFTPPKTFIPRAASFSRMIFALAM